MDVRTGVGMETGSSGNILVHNFTPRLKFLPQFRRLEEAAWIWVHPSVCQGRPFIPATEMKLSFVLKSLNHNRTKTQKD